MTHNMSIRLTDGQFARLSRDAEVAGVSLNKRIGQLIEDAPVFTAEDISILHTAMAIAAGKSWRALEKQDMVHPEDSRETMAFLAHLSSLTKRMKSKS